MKALSLWQPWATLMAYGVKRFETRHWRTAYRGPLVIHAAKTRQALDAYLDILWELEDEDAVAALPALEVLPFGAIVAAGHLDEIFPTETCGNLSPDERLCGDYAPGRFAWGFTTMRRLDPPIPWRGRQGLFEVPDDFEARR